MSTLLIVLVLILSATVISLGVALIVALAKLQVAKQVSEEAIEQAHALLKQKEAEWRKDAATRSRRAVRGQTAEQFAPYLKGFGYIPKDCRFLGSPIDFIVFEGMTEGHIDRIVLIEVKTGSSKLSPRQRQIETVVDLEEVYFEEFRI